MRDADPMIQARMMKIGEEIVSELGERFPALRDVELCGEWLYFGACMADRVNGVDAEMKTRGAFYSGTKQRFILTPEASGKANCEGRFTMPQIYTLHGRVAVG